MALTRRHGSPYWQYEILCGGRRHRGSTGEKNRRAAEVFQRQKRAEIQAALAASVTTVDPATAPGAMALEFAAAIYQAERGAFTARPQTLQAILTRIVDEFGAGTRLDEIDSARVSQAIAVWRGRNLANASINRTLLEPLRQVYNHVAARDPGVHLPAPTWKRLMLPEPREIVREASPQLEARIFAEFRPDYRPVFRFAILSGMRLGSLVSLTWPDIDLKGRQLRVRIKGGHWHEQPLTGEMVALLAGERDHHPQAVFTYVVTPGAARRMQGAAGERRPITYQGLKTQWRRVKDKLELGAFRFHDLRHTAATRLLRASGNLRAVQHALGHTSVATTIKYAHASIDDVRAAMERESQLRAQAASNPAENPDQPPMRDAMHDSPTLSPHTGGKTRQPKKLSS